MRASGTRESASLLDEGNLLIFTGSFAHDKAEAVAVELEVAGEIALVGAFKALRVYRKVSPGLRRAGEA